MIEMTRIGLQIVSDLHLEFIKSSQRLAYFDKMVVPRAKNLALLGDICLFEDTKFLADFLQHLDSIYERVFYVPGNHEFYSSKQLPWTELLNRAQELTKGTRVEIINKGTVTLGDYQLILTTLWSRVPDSAKEEVSKALNDYRLIYMPTGLKEGKPRCLTVDYTNHWNQRCREFLFEEIAKAREAGKTSIVLTHHAPLIEGTYAPKFAGTKHNWAFVNDFSDQMMRVELWAFGHTHWCCDFQHPNPDGTSTRVISNAAGYSRVIDPKYQTSLVVI